MTRAHIPDDFPNRIKRLERQVRILERTSKLNSASIGSGGLTVKDGGDIFLKGPDGEIVWQASEDPIRTQYDWAEDNAMSLPTGWTDHWSEKRIDVPTGYASGHFLAVGNAGDTFSGEGNVSVGVRLRYELSDGSEQTFSGPVINSGNNSVSVATAFWSSNMTFDRGNGLRVTRIRFGVQTARAGTEASATSGNWHESASVIFRRGAMV